MHNRHGSCSGNRLVTVYQTSTVSHEHIGTQFGEMAQHQTNIEGPNGPVYTKQLEVYEKVETAVNRGRSPLTSADKLYPATSWLSFSGFQQDVCTMLLSTSLLRVSTFPIRQQYSYRRHCSLGRIALLRNSPAVPRSANTLDLFRIREGGVC